MYDPSLPRRIKEKAVSGLVSTKFLLLSGPLSQAPVAPHCDRHEDCGRNVRPKREVAILPPLRFAHPVKHGLSADIRKPKNGDDHAPGDEQPERTKNVNPPGNGIVDDRDLQ